jgi:hypothetical protein
MRLAERWVVTKASVNENNPAMKRKVKLEIIYLDSQTSFCPALAIQF